MKKIISLFQRNYETDRLVRDEIVPGAEWVVAGEGIATRKLDGTCCMIRNRQLFKRYELKGGKKAPPFFEPAQEPDPVTGDTPGWVPVGGGPEDQYYREAFQGIDENDSDGTYELIGPKVQRNPEKVSGGHVLVPHGAFMLPDAPRTFNELKIYLQSHDIEGIVWHHPDGRMVKIKGKDFGLKRQ